MERTQEVGDRLIDLGDAVVETKGIMGLSQDVDQTPYGAAGILDE